MSRPRRRRPGLTFTNRVLSNITISQDHDCNSSPCQYETGISSYNSNDSFLSSFDQSVVTNCSTPNEPATSPVLHDSFPVNSLPPSPSFEETAKENVPAYEEFTDKDLTLDSQPVPYVSSPFGFQQQQTQEEHSHSSLKQEQSSILDFSYVANTQSSLPSSLVSKKDRNSQQTQGSLSSNSDSSCKHASPKSSGSLVVKTQITLSSNDSSQGSKKNRNSQKSQNLSSSHNKSNNERASSKSSDTGRVSQCISTPTSSSSQHSKHSKSTQSSLNLRQTTLSSYSSLSQSQDGRGFDNNSNNPSLSTSSHLKGGQRKPALGLARKSIASPPPSERDTKKKNKELKDIISNSTDLQSNSKRRPSLGLSKVKSQSPSSPPH